MEEMWRSPVKVGSLSMLIPLFTGFYTSQVGAGFLGSTVFLMNDIKGIIVWGYF